MRTSAGSRVSFFARLVTWPFVSPRAVLLGCVLHGAGRAGGRRGLGVGPAVHPGRPGPGVTRQRPGYSLPFPASARTGLSTGGSGTRTQQYDVTGPGPQR